MSDAPRFDEHAFAGKRPKAISATTGLAYSDYVGRMSTQKNEGHSRSPRRIPAFALDNAKLAKVIRVKLWRYVHNVGEPPETMTLQELEKEVAVRRAKYSSKDKCQKTHLACTQRHGVAGFLARICWLSFRLRYVSGAVAEEMQLSSSVQVRQQLCRIAAIGRELFPDDSLAVSVKRRTRLGWRKRPDAAPRRSPKRKMPDAKARAARALQVKALRDAGKTYKQIGERLGVDHGTARNDFLKLVGPHSEGTAGNQIEKSA